MIRIYNSKNAEFNKFMKMMSNRMNADYTEEQRSVDEIIAAVRDRGDEAVFEYTEKFDLVALDSESIYVTEKEMNEAVDEVGAEMMDVLKKSAMRIQMFHERQRQQSWFSTENEGEILGQIVRPLGVVGVYAPGGKAAYPSSLLMGIIPAKVAGVKKIILCSPAAQDGKLPAVTLAAAKVAGVDEIYKIGGAQAIAAMAFGTESVPRVDKIVGPGNIYVALAKKSVFGQVNIDSIAGPSDILVVADETAKPNFLAADLLSQAEHDELASAILVTNSEEIAIQTQKEVERQIGLLPKKDIAAKSLERYGAIIITKSIEEAVDISNEIAPEHLELCVCEPFATLTKITNAGAIFMGHYTPETLGDYLAGPNHVLPTGGTARFFSPLSVEDFVKKSSILYFSKEAFLDISNTAVKFAEAEGLTAHAEAVRVRK